jgi:hypothetical protein
LIPRSAAPFSLGPGEIDRAALDPDTTGSIEKRTPRSRPPCNTLAWFPDRPPDQAFREAC